MLASRSACWNWDCRFGPLNAGGLRVNKPRTSVSVRSTNHLGMHSPLRSARASWMSVTLRSSRRFVQRRLCQRFQTEESTLHHNQRCTAFCEPTRNSIDELEHKSHRSVRYRRIGQQLSEIFGSPIFRGCEDR